MAVYDSEKEGKPSSSGIITITNYREYSNAHTLEFLESYEQRIASIADSNGSGYYRKSKLRVGIITDSFMYNYYDGAVDLVYVTPKGYEEIIDSGIDALLYVSCWLGMREPDSEGLYEYRPKRAVELVPQIFAFAKQRGIPCLFQTIEDPPSYKLYLPIAKAADVIITSAASRPSLRYIFIVCCLDC